jgi:putative Holliday junction resolvase
MRTLAVDPGTKRVGLAISDPTGTIAQGLTTIGAEPADTLPSRLADVAKVEGASRVVVGLPRRLDGSYGPEAVSARALGDAIRKASGLPVEMVDERMTTAEAERSLLAGGMHRSERRASIDRVAATLLLQSHLDRVKATSGAQRRSPREAE